MDGEREALLVHVGDQVRHSDLRLQVGVRQVAPEADLVAGVAIVVAVVVVGERNRGDGGEREHGNACRDAAERETERHGGLLESREW